MGHYFCTQLDALAANQPGLYGSSLKDGARGAVERRTHWRLAERLDHTGWRVAGWSAGNYVQGMLYRHWRDWRD